MKKTLIAILAVVFIISCCAGCTTNTDDTAGVTAETVTETVTNENGETVTEVVTDTSGKTVTETVTETITKEDGTTETVTKTVPVTQPVTQITTKITTTTKKSGGSSGSSSKSTTTKRTTTTTRPSGSSKPTATTKPSTTRPATTKPATTKPTTTKPTTTKHTHNWVAQTKTETTYKWEQHAFCNGCGMDLTEGAREYGISANLYQIKHITGNGVPKCSGTLGDSGTGHYEQVKVATGTKKIITGYKCSTCGATKSP